MKRQPFGEYEISTTLGEEVRAFVPPRIQPLPELQFSPGAQGALDRALLSLGRLDGAAATMPDVDLLLYTFVRKEAVLSSQIEGTQSTLDDLLAHEINEVPGVPIDDVREVSRYVDALGYGMRLHRSKVSSAGASPPHLVTKEDLEKAIRLLKELVIATERSLGSWT